MIEGKGLALMCSIICIVILWAFATSTQVNGQHTKLAFIIKSIFYWIAIIIAISLGYTIAK